MKTESQSFMDFVDLINILPVKSIIVRRSPVNNKEAKVLFDLWQGDRDQYGKIIVAKDTDPIQMATLATKGMIKTKEILSSKSPIRYVEFTKKGKEVIRNIILHSEQSAFEKHSDIINYQNIHNKASKTASADTDTLHLEQDSWLQRAIWK